MDPDSTEDSTLSTVDEEECSRAEGVAFVKGLYEHLDLEGKT